VETIGEPSEWAIFYQAHTIEESRARAKHDPDYANFLQSWAQDQFDESLSDGGAVVLSRPENAAPASAEVRAFAEQYNNTSITQIKPKGGVVTMSDGTKYSWSQFQTLLAKATQARLC
jgi:hypothetical protein